MSTSVKKFVVFKFDSVLLRSKLVISKVYISLIFFHFFSRKPQIIINLMAIKFGDAFQLMFASCRASLVDGNLLATLYLI